MSGALPHEEHFCDAEQQAHAARFGMWVFLSSELLLFAGLFALYFSYRAAWREAFHQGAGETLMWVGAVGTGLLLTASLLAALAVHFAEHARRRAAAGSLLGTAVLAAGFLGLKAYEYADHLEKGLVPGGSPRLEAGERGEQVFWTLYYAATGLHAVHVLIGIASVTGAALWVVTRKDPRPHAHVVENCANYWHLVDGIWLFLWPMFYLMRGGG